MCYSRLRAFFAQSDEYCGLRALLDWLNMESKVMNRSDES